MQKMKLPHDFPHKPPKGYSYEVREHKRNVVSIWLRHHYNYVYSGGECVATIWGFYNTKKQEYQSPINSTKCGDTVDIDNTRPYTAMPLHLNPLEAAFV